MRSIAIGLVFAGLWASAAAGGVYDIYIQAAAAAEKCTGRVLTGAEAASLAAAITANGHGPASPGEVSSALAAARTTAQGVNCSDLYTQIHLQFFQRSILPALEPKRAATAAPAGV